MKPFHGINPGIKKRLELEAEVYHGEADAMDVAVIMFATIIYRRSNPGHERHPGAGKSWPA